MSSLLPPNATALEKAWEATFNQQLQQIGLAHIANQWHAAHCPKPLLPYLAWAVNVPDWDPAWPEATQRAVIAASPEVQRHQGTAGSLAQALQTLGLEVTIEEQALYRFHISVRSTGLALDQALYQRLGRQIRATQAARCHYQITLIVALYLTQQHVLQITSTPVIVRTTWHTV